MQLQSQGWYIFRFFSGGKCLNKLACYRLRICIKAFALNISTSDPISRSQAIV